MFLPTGFLGNKTYPEITRFPATILWPGTSPLCCISDSFAWREVRDQLGIWQDGVIRRDTLGTHQSYLNKNKLEYYLDEYVFRYNRRTSKSRGLLFLRLIEQAVIIAPISYEKIINENHG
jgi:hypothetical protein